MQDLIAAPENTSAYAVKSTPLVLEPLAQRTNMVPYILTQGRITVGASDDCDIVIPVTGVDDRHCLFVVGEHRTVILSWTHKTWLNDAPVKEQRLRAGDRLSIGPVGFRVREALPAEIPQAQRRDPKRAEKRHVSADQLTNDAAPAPRGTAQHNTLDRETSPRDDIYNSETYRNSERHRDTVTPQRGTSSSPAPQPPAPVPSDAHQELEAAIRRAEQSLTEQGAKLQQSIERQEEMLTEIRRHEELEGQAQSLFAQINLKDQQLEELRQQLKLTTQDEQRQREEFTAAQQDEARNLREQLDSQARLLAEQQDRITRLTDESRNHRTSAESRADELRELQSQLAVAQSDFDQQQSEAQQRIDQLQQELDERARQLDERDARILDTITELEQRETGLAESEEQANERRSQLEADREEIERLRRELDATREEHAQIHAAQVEQLTSQREELDQLVAQQQTREEALAAAENCAEALRSELETLRGRLAANGTGSIDPNTEAQNAESEALRQEIEEQRRTLEEQQQQVEAERAELEARLNLSDDRQSEIDQAQLDLHDQQERLEEERRRFQEECEQFNREQDELRAGQQATPPTDATPSELDPAPTADAESAEGEPIESGYSSIVETMMGGPASSTETETEMPQRADPSPVDHDEALASAGIDTDVIEPKTIHTEDVIADENLPLENNAIDSDTEEMHVAESIADAPPAEPAGEGQEDPHLRSQLAGLFGMTADGTRTDHGSDAVDEPIGDHRGELMDDTDETKSAADGPTGSGFLLQKMLSGDSDVTPVEDVHADESPAEDCIVEEPASEPSPQDAITTRLQAMTAAAEATKRASKERKPRPPVPEASPTDAGDGEELSVAAYMQRLLSRGGNSAASVPIPVATAKPARAVGTVHEVIAEPAAPIEPQKSKEDIQVEAEARKQKRAEDANRLREETHSFREVANLSARTAVAKYSMEQKKNSIVIKVSVAILSVIFSLGLLVWRMIDSDVSTLPVLIAFIGTGIVVADLVYTKRHIDQYLNTGVNDEIGTDDSEMVVGQ